MNLWQAFKMAWKSIMGKKGRSALTILGIFIGIAAVMTIVSVMDGYRTSMLARFSAMGTGRLSVNIWTWMWDDQGNDVSPDYYPDLYNYCNMRDDIMGITPEGYVEANVVYGTKNSANMEYKYDDNWNLLEAPPELYYGSDQYSQCNNLKLLRGRDLSYLDIQNYNQVIVLGYDAAFLFFGTQNPIGQTMQVRGNDFTVVGVYASRLSDASANNSMIDNFMVFPFTTRRLLGGEKPRRFIVKLADDAEADETTALMQGFLKGLVGEDNFYISSNDQMTDMVNAEIGVIGGVLAGIAAISLLVGGIGIMNIMLVTVTERTREIGIRRAIGAQRGSIVAQFLIEAAMLCGIGGVVGIGVGTAGSLALGNIMFHMTIYPSFYVTAGAFSLSVALGVIFGSYPAVKASRLQPVDALRAE